MATKKKLPGDRAVKSGLVISLGPLTAIGDLVSPKVPNAGKVEKTNYACPHCTDTPQGVEQYYRCKHDPSHDDMKPSDLARMAPFGDEFVFVSQEAIAAAKAEEGEEGGLELRVHRRSDMMGKILPSGTTYVFRPTAPGPVPAILATILSEDEDLALIGKVVMRQEPKLMMLTLGLNGQLVLQELTWPEDLKTMERPEYEAPPKVLAQAQMLVEASIEDFDPEQYRKLSRQRIGEVIADAAGTEYRPDAPVAPKAAPDADVIHLEDVLARALEAKRAERGAA